VLFLLAHSRRPLSLLADTVGCYCWLGDTPLWLLLLAWRYTATPVVPWLCPRVPSWRPEWPFGVCCQCWLSPQTLHRQPTRLCRQRKRRRLARPQSTGSSRYLLACAMACMACVCRPEAHTRHLSSQLPVLVASCVLVGIMASFAVYYDDDGDLTILDQTPGGDRQAKSFGVWIGSGLFVLGCGGLCFQDSWGHYPP
jgi:hypothetical protein